jgi:hypothetical protein
MKGITTCPYNPTVLKPFPKNEWPILIYWAALFPPKHCVVAISILETGRRETETHCRI